MEYQPSVKDIVTNFEAPDNSPVKAMSPNGYMAMRAEKKKKESVVPIPENNTDEIHTNSAVVLAQHALDTARAPVDTNNPPVRTPLAAIRDQVVPSCWTENGCKIGACLGGTLAVIGTIFAVLAYLNDICVFPKCEEKPDISKPCWDNDVNYVSTRFGTSFNLTDENLYKKDSA